MRRIFIIIFFAGIISGCGNHRSKNAETDITIPEQLKNTMRVDLSEAYKARKDSLVNFYAGMKKGGYIQIAACFFANKNLDWAFTKLDTLMQNPSGDMFWMYQFITVTYAGRNILPPKIKKQMRKLWQTYTPYRGDTENHWAMYYTALYLITQMYPDASGSNWFTGKSSQENFKEAEDYLLSWMDLTTTVGQGEFDSPDYFGVYIVPMAQLYGYAKDPRMKQRAAMMLDYLIADFAAENLDGLYLGGHSRTYPAPVLNQWSTTAAGISWLLFGNTPFRARGEVLVLAISGYEPPEILHHIATDRTKPYVHRELKRTRHRIRFSDLKNAPVYKYTFMRKEYGIGSLQGGLLQPIQQHTWDVTWAIDDPRKGFNTIFTVHPYSSGKELAMYFPEEIKLMTNAVVKSKNTYDSPDKWTSASPYEQVFQFEDAMIVLYNIPEGTRFPHISGFFPKSLKKREIDRSGWIFCHGGDAYIAYYPLADYRWIEEEHNWRLHSESLKNGAVVQAAPISDFKSFKKFKKKILSLDLKTEKAPEPYVKFTTLHDSLMEFTYDKIPMLNKKLVDYKNWKLFDGPFLYAEKNSKKLEIRYKSLHRLLNFNTLSIKEWIE